VLTATHQLGQRRADTALVVRDQNSHGGKMAEEGIPAE
jgi:hypothetical protein